jgi:hypothetical protein
MREKVATEINHGASACERPLRIYIDVGSSYEFLTNGIPLTGIQRVEVEIGKVLVGRNHTAVVWNPALANYRELPPSNFNALTNYADEFDIDALTARQDATGIQFKDILLLRLSIALSLIVPKVGSFRANLIKRIVVNFGRTARALSSSERRTIVRLLKLNRRVERRNLFLSEFRRSTAKVELRPGDVLFMPTPMGYSMATSQFIAMAERGVLIVPASQGGLLSQLSLYP